MLDPAIRAHYEVVAEQPRLEQESRLEFARTRDLLERYLPPPPATVLDVGGGPGVYSALLADKGYTVRLVDPVPLHVEQARMLSQSHPFAVSLGDARSLQAADESFEVVLLMGPLYHLVERGDRLQALREAARVVKRGGRVIGVGISRFASLLDGLRSGWLDDPLFRDVVEGDLLTGQHRNPRPEARPEWFTTAYFHRPGELADETETAGLVVDVVLGIEGPGWLIWSGLWDDPRQRAALLDAARLVESEPSIIGSSSHLMIVAHR
jgi:ubiquinone/menaquinone biosynthesis C-methylase UbiE